ncbi:MAG TPA: DinB family protein [Candidatus Limnocylindrales bacterium]|nr:DinB family protein [Candidatus Limnocylindrales bacterium]
MSLTPLFAHWAVYNRLFVEGIRGLDAEELGLRADVADAATAAHWPIWAIAAHTAGARIYWLCVRAGEPGLDQATFVDAVTGDGWEDDLSTPRSAAEVADALAMSWTVIDGALARWTPELLAEPIAVESDGAVVHHTRESILLRLLTHDAYHVGEIALIQGIHGRTQIDLWPPGVHTVEGGQA